MHNICEGCILSVNMGRACSTEPVSLAHTPLHCHSRVSLVRAVSGEKCSDALAINRLELSKALKITSALNLRSSIFKPFS